MCGGRVERDVSKNRPPPMCRSHDRLADHASALLGARQLDLGHNARGATHGVLAKRPVRVALVPLDERQQEGGVAPKALQRRERNLEHQSIVDVRLRTRVAQLRLGGRGEQPGLTDHIVRVSPEDEGEVGGNHAALDDQIDAVRRIARVEQGIVPVEVGSPDVLGQPPPIGKAEAAEQHVAAQQVADLLPIGKQGVGWRCRFHGKNVLRSRFHKGQQSQWVG